MTRRSSSSKFGQSMIILGVVVVLAGAYGYTQRRVISHSVLGASLFRGMYASATITLPNVPTAASLNIYYKATGDQAFIHSVRGLSPTSTTYTINYLKKGTAYAYKVAAVDAHGREVWFSHVSPITNVQPM